jgi:N-acetylmuramoyl-L-alanine amidase
MRHLLAAVLLLATAAPAQDWIEDCGLQPPGSVLTPPVPPKHWEPVLTPDSPALVRPDRRVPRIGGFPNASVRGVGALAGKVIYLSPGHGFTWTSTIPEWRTQRGNTNSIVEDLVSVETLSQYLMPMLLNAGARVVPVRELDLNTNLVLIDNGEAGYAETGAGFTTSTLLGWGRPTFPMTGAALPFTLGSNRLMPSSPTVTASATYTASIPRDGYYDVSVSYMAFTSRVTDAHYLVRHAGGETHFRVNQQRHGGTWVQLGRFYFRQGGTAQVVVQNDSTNAAGTNLSLDAVKFGGGMGLIERGAGASGRPRFEEASRYQAQWAGAPATVFAANGNTPADDRTNDVGTRSRFTAWAHEPGEDAVYVAWHTNAFNGTAVGTNTYIYGPGAPPSPLSQFSGVAGSDRLALLIHGEMVNDIRATSGWNRPTWQDRGVNTAYFGELNPANNGEVPATLLEVAFHDAAADALHLKEPGFRYLAARSITQGIIKYFAERDTVAALLPPEPPTHVAALNQAGGALIRWRAPPTDAQGVRGQAATGYRLYSSDDGLGWDNGVDVTTTSTMAALPGIAAKYFRVTATNGGGESFPSAVVGVKAPVAGKPLVLVVNGFDRLEAAIGKTESFASRYALNNVLRIFIERMNDGSAARITGEALAANDVGFDTAESDAVTSGDVAQTPYQLLTWFVGRGKQGGAALTAAEQGVVTGFRGRNLPVFFSGDGTATAPLLTALSGTAPGTTGGLSVNGADALMGLTGLALDDGTNGSFDTGAPPTVAPAGGAVQLASYGSGGSAAVGVPGQSVMFGFPFETLVDRPSRAQVMCRVLDFLNPSTFDCSADAGAVVPDAGVPDAGSDAGVTEADAGVEVDAGVVPGDDAGVIRQPVLAFQGGGCSAVPVIAPLLVALILRRRRPLTPTLSPLPQGEGDQ